MAAPEEPPTIGDARPRRSHRATVITIVVGVVLMVAVFAFLFPKLGDYTQAFQELIAIPPGWLVALGLACLANIVLYPFTATAAIPGLRYRVAFVDRQSGFLVSNVIPGGGAFAVGTQYSVLARYGVSPTAAAAAISADAVWTYLMVLGAPSLAVVLLIAEGRSAAGYTTAAIIGLVVVIVSLVAIIAVLRSRQSAERIGTWLQRPADWAWGKVHRVPPDVATQLVDFNVQASALVQSRWRIITVTNVTAQLTPYVVLMAALYGLGGSPEPVTWIEAFAAYSIALLLTSFPLTPGGLGTVDAALVLLLTRFGLESSTAIATDLVWRLVWFLPQLAVGVVALGLFTWDQRRGRRA